jgi:hypothetical protein
MQIAVFLIVSLVYSNGEMGQIEKRSVGLNLQNIIAMPNSSFVSSKAIK